MPSRHLRSLSEPPPLHHNIRLLPPLLAGTLTLILILLIVLIVLFYRKITRNRTAAITKSPNHHRHQCRCYSYSLLRRATSSFSPSNRLGRGGFGSVYKATLANTNQHLAVKLMDQNGSLQGEREFHNELSIASCLDSPNIVSLLGYSCSRKKKLVLVYELMENRSLQEALFDRKCEELMSWKVRYELVIGVAKGLEYLHHFCSPPVIHGDIKPGNILLDSCFNAKIGDFGLARLKIEESNGFLEKKDGFREDNGSILEETESVASGCGESGIIDVSGVVRSPESFGVRVLDSDASPEMCSVVSPEVGVDKGSISEAGFDKMSVDSGRDLSGGGKKGGSRRDWWWKQDNGGGSESGRVKDYVMEWIGSEINKERPKQEWNAASPIFIDNKLLSTKRLKSGPKKHKKKLEWWASLDEERMKRNRKPREWWKEEFCEELTKKKKKRGLSSSNSGDSWWQKDDDGVQERKRKRRSKGSRGSVDWWMDGFSGEFINGRRNSQDWASGEIPKSGGVSSTPSMRGTVCYIAPEYGGGGLMSEKCDVYSFGVLLLVVVSGRRPLQVTASPMSEFERANLISWARQLACNGKLLDLVDTSVHSLDKEQALLCITIGLLCLQKSPSKRPTLKEIVGMLSGEAEPPHLPFEFSPSPPSNFPFKSRRKARQPGIIGTIGQSLTNLDGENGEDGKDDGGELDDLGEELVDSLLLDGQSEGKKNQKQSRKESRSDSRGKKILSRRMRMLKRQMQCRLDINRLNAVFLAIYESLIPSEEEKVKQEQFFMLLEKLVNKEWPEAGLYLYGSCANSFGVSKSDIDVCLAIEDAEINKSEVLLKLADILQSDNLQNVQALTRARVPIVKLMDPVTGISCDICINNVLAVVNTKLLRDYAQIDVRLRQLAFIVKHWAKSRGVNATYQGTLSSYAYVLMCIHFLQQRRPAILPCLQEIGHTYSVTVDDIQCAYFDQVEKLRGFGSGNKETIARLVWGFFNYWAYSHDYANAVISVRTGSILSKHEKEWTRRNGNDRHLICIEDPFEISHDLGRVVDKFSIKVLREEFERAADILHNDPNPCATLFEPYIPS